MSSELTVIAKDDEKTLRFKHLIYETYSADMNDPTIQRCINESLKNFLGTPTDIQVKISMSF
jgi:hypothetical protein